MEPTAFQTAVTAIQTALTGNVNDILPVAGTLFALVFGIKMIPRLVKAFARG